ncbi:acyl-CoA/acyl-ACP dehydrogenase [Photobacterium damselae subsp. damselae]|uniref:acyl-CoA dehydrogenase family protein n=1 Tax=Photobacterium damselae TaxID=38293 RepID=UPI001F3B7575|nr:acyl-CoA dehydrogenase family protein [Photobacterium damselae]UKA05803.1 acyl-CoA/acyl-ACP dehydrogenase [Photobacterium damselae subsp. damselae]UKA20909.1 acyl-CoA/acyl-ACP dehydrogenase [Photobacterium damselae subsp. damselae]
MLFNPQKHNFHYKDQETQQLMQKVIDFFEAKGLKSIKKDWHDKVWNYEFVDFMKDNQVLATLMTPEGYGDPSARWDTYRNTKFAEIIGFYGITYWYTFQVSMLGVAPVWLGSNEKLKYKAAQLLQEGHVCAFGLSEKEHGADIYSSEMKLVDKGNGYFEGSGSKYYIGNGNEAGLVSTFGKVENSDDYVFFVVDSKHPQYTCVKNTVNEQIHVSEYTINHYPITAEDISERGQKAWDDMLNTINICKFNLGFASIGLCEHAFYEAINHAAHRNIYGKYVTDFPHIQRLFVDAYARLCAMKLFSERACDYMRSASQDDRRYLLFNPMVKMKVTSQGEEVINHLWDVIAAKGFEQEPFFETAAHEIRMLPKLEGTVHVNMALVVKFMQNYLFNPKDYPVIPHRDDVANDDFLFNQGPTRGLGKIQFHDYQQTYDAVKLENVEIFKQQIAAFKDYLLHHSPSQDQARDVDYILAMGECFTLIVYGHLILERAQHLATEDILINEIFDVLVRDMSHYALTLANKPSSTSGQYSALRLMQHKPHHDQERFKALWQSIYSLSGSYTALD